MFSPSLLTHWHWIDFEISSHSNFVAERFLNKESVFKISWKLNFTEIAAIGNILAHKNICSLYVGILKKTSIKDLQNWIGRLQIHSYSSFSFSIQINFHSKYLKGCPENCLRGTLPPVRVRVWFRISVGIRANFLGAIFQEPFKRVKMLKWSKITM